MIKVEDTLRGLNFPSSLCPLCLLLMEGQQVFTGPDRLLPLERKWKPLRQSYKVAKRRACQLCYYEPLSFLLFSCLYLLGAGLGLHLYTVLRSKHCRSWAISASELVFSAWPAGIRGMHSYCCSSYSGPKRHTAHLE